MLICKLATFDVAENVTQKVDTTKKRKKKEETWMVIPSDALNDFFK